MTLRDILDNNTISYRQLDYWIRQGYIKAGPNKGRGVWRTVEEDERFVAHEMVRLVDAGLSVAKAAEVARLHVENPTPDSQYLIGVGITITIA